MDFPPISPLSPSKFSNEHLNILAKTNRQLKTTHGKSRDGLNHRLQKDFFTCLRQNYFLPPLKLTPHSIFNVVQARLFLLPTTTGNPKYLSYSLILDTPSRFFTSSLVAKEALLLKKRVVLFELIFDPMPIHIYLVTPVFFPDLAS